MDCILSGANVFYNDEFVKKDILISDGVISAISNEIPLTEGAVVFKLNNKYIFPGFVDVHVHLREPGFSYKETIYSGTMAAAHGGYTSICSMPNLNPVPDCKKSLDVQLDLINKTANINVYPYASITKAQKGTELSCMDELKNDCVAFSDDGKGLQSTSVMMQAMDKAKELGKIIAAHCENNSLLNSGYIHRGKYAKEHSHAGICSESEWSQIERDLFLAKISGCKYHVCHISAKESVELIRMAKADGIDVTCETAPHYLTLCENDLQEDGRFKMNPPLRGEDDKAALIKGILDGTIDMIATDHAPHSKEEKSKGLEKSAMGIVGLETAFPVLYTKLVRSNIISLKKLIELMNVNPSKRFSIGTKIATGETADLTVFDLDEKYIINSDDFLSKGKATPFEGNEVFGKCKMTMRNGIIIWQDKS